VQAVLLWVFANVYASISLTHTYISIHTQQLEAAVHSQFAHKEGIHAYGKAFADSVAQKNLGMCVCVCVSERERVRVCVSEREINRVCE
jgi:hypothetical protein